MKTVVDIETWGIPEAYAKERYPGGSLYSKQTGDKCCLGFSTLQAGITPEQAADLAYPVCLSCGGYGSGLSQRLAPELFPAELKAFGDPDTGESSPLASMAATINDSESTPWKAKIALLQNLFRIHNQEIEFRFQNKEYYGVSGQDKAINTFLKRKREKHARKLKRAEAIAESREF